MPRFLIEIIGGDSDGRTFDTESADPIERQSASAILHMTRNGTVGVGFNGLSLSAVEAISRGEKNVGDFTAANAKHSYTVVERLEDADSVLVLKQAKSLNWVAENSGKNEIPRRFRGILRVSNP